MNEEKKAKTFQEMSNTQTCGSYNPVNFASQATLATAPNFLTCPTGQVAWSVPSTDGSNQKLWFCGPNNMTPNQNLQYTNSAIEAVTQQPPNLFVNPNSSYPNDCYGTVSQGGITGAIEVWGNSGTPNANAQIPASANNTFNQAIKAAQALSSIFQ